MDNVMPPAAACSRSKAAESSAPTKAASELDSSTSSVLKPAFFRWNFDLSGSYARCGRSAAEKPVGARTGLFVAEGAVTSQDGAQLLLTVDAVLDCQAHIVVGERGGRAIHQKCEMLAAHRAHDAQGRVALEQIDGLEIDAVDRMHLTRYQGIGAGRDIIDDKQLDRIHPRGIRPPVIRIALEQRAHARRVLAEDE